MKTNLWNFLSNQPRSVKDLAVIAGLSVVVFTLSAQVHLFDMIIAWVYRHNSWQLDEVFMVTLYLVFAGGIYAWRRHGELAEQIRQRQAAEAEKARLIPELENALADISTLKKLLPICSSCRRVRDDRGSWSQVDVYLETHFSTRVDDGICPDCARELYKPASGLRVRP